MEVWTVGFRKSFAEPRNGSSRSLRPIASRRAANSTCWLPRKGGSRRGRERDYAALLRGATTTTGDDQVRTSGR
jgi:hypothetical protein